MPCGACGYVQTAAAQQQLRAQQRQQTTQFHASAHHLDDPYVMRALNNLGEVEMKLDRISLACWYFSEAYHMHQRMEIAAAAAKQAELDAKALEGILPDPDEFVDDEAEALAQLHVATMQCNLGVCLLRGGAPGGGTDADVARATGLIKEALATRKFLLGDAHVATLLATNYFKMTEEVNTMIAEIEESRREEAAEALEEAERAAREAAEADADALKKKLLPSR